MNSDELHWAMARPCQPFSAVARHASWHTPGRRCGMQDRPVLELSEDPNHEIDEDQRLLGDLRGTISNSG